MAAILVGGRGHRIKFWTGIAQGPFHQSLVMIQIGQAVSEEFLNIFPIKSYVKTMSADGRQGHRI